MRLFKTLIATVALAMAVIVPTFAENGFTATMIGGNRVLTATLTAGS